MDEMTDETDPRGIPVPDPDGQWGPIWEFALTYNLRRRAGDDWMDVGTAATNAVAARWGRGEMFTEDLHQLRAALFFEQRRFAHYGWDPTGRMERYIRALVRHIDELTNGHVPGLPDRFP